MSALSKAYRIRPGDRFRLEAISTSHHPFCKDKDESKKDIPVILERLSRLQNLLYANKTRSLLVILQGMDTSGKDGTIRHVMSGVSPQGCQVASFKEPTPEELAHDFLWRVHAKIPPKGFIGIFNRSHYEDVLVTRVHHLISDDVARKRLKNIQHFEKLLTVTGTVILKFFLHISKEEQRRRLQARIEDPHKRWKLSPTDLTDRKKWKEFQKVYEQAIMATSTDAAPWFIIPADHKWYRNWVVGHLVGPGAGSDGFENAQTGSAN